MVDKSIIGRATPARRYMDEELRQYLEGMETRIEAKM
jgi:hypothetical protein